MKKLSLVLILSLLISVLSFQSCTKEEESMKAPELPKTSMMAMDYNGFDTVDPDHRSINNWVFSALNIYFWTGTVAHALHIPIVAFVAAVNQEAVYQGANTWMWEYEVDVAEGVFNIQLYASLTMIDEVHWQMFVSKEGAYSDVLWFSGETAYDDSYANWTLNKFTEDPSDPFSQEEFLLINFQRNLDSGKEQIRYTNIIPNNNGNGSYIQYGNTSEGDYPVFYDIFRSEIDNMTEIEFRPVDNTGRVKDLNHFHDDDWHCWNEDLQDVDCDDN